MMRREIQNAVGKRNPEAAAGDAAGCVMREADIPGKAFTGDQPASDVRPSGRTIYRETGKARQITAILGYDSRPQPGEACPRRAHWGSWSPSDGWKVGLAKKASRLERRAAQKPTHSGPSRAGGGTRPRGPARPGGYRLRSGPGPAQPQQPADEPRKMISNQEGPVLLASAVGSCLLWRLARRQPGRPAA